VNDELLLQVSVRLGQDEAAGEIVDWSCHTSSVAPATGYPEQTLANDSFWPIVLKNSLRKLEIV